MVVDVERYQTMPHRREACKICTRGGCFRFADVLFDIILNVFYAMDPLEMLSKIVCPWPLLVLSPATGDSALEVFPPGAGVGMAASSVSVDIVRSAETFGTNAAGDVTVVGLRVLLSVFPGLRVSQLFTVGIAVETHTSIQISS